MAREYALASRRGLLDYRLPLSKPYWRNRAWIAQRRSGIDGVVSIRQAELGVHWRSQAPRLGDAGAHQVLTDRFNSWGRLHYLAHSLELGNENGV